MCQEGSKQTALKSLFLSRCSTPCNRKQRHLQKAAAHKHHSGREHSVRAGVPLPQKVLLKRAPARTGKKKETPKGRSGLKTSQQKKMQPSLRTRFPARSVFPPSSLLSGTNPVSLALGTVLKKGHERELDAG